MYHKQLPLKRPWLYARMKMTLHCKGAQIMANHWCNLWKSLLHDKLNRGQIYNDFLIDKLQLTNHLTGTKDLEGCQKCQQLIIDLGLPSSDMIPNNDMTTEEFSKAIRELWALANKSKNSLWG